MELPEFCNYLNKHVSKRELREICQIINIPFYEDEKPSDTCIRIENSAGYIMSPKHINILKVLAKYSAYIIGVLGLLYLSSRNGKWLNLSENSGDNFSALTFSDRNKASWKLFKDSLKSLKFLFYPEFLEYRGMEYETVQYLNEPILLFLAKFTATFGFLSLISNTLRTLGMSKIRHQVFQVLGKDTRESKGENRKRTIKKK